MNLLSQLLVVTEQAFDVSQNIPVRLTPVKIHPAMRIAIKLEIYAYDAFYIQRCIETNLPLISLDNRVFAVAKNLGIQVVE